MVWYLLQLWQTAALFLETVSFLVTSFSNTWLIHCSLMCPEDLLQLGVNIMPQFSGWHFYFIFGTSKACLNIWSLVVLADSFCIFPLFTEGNGGILSLPHLLNLSLIILPSTVQKGYQKFLNLSLRLRMAVSTLAIFGVSLMSFATIPQHCFSLGVYCCIC